MNQIPLNREQLTQKFATWAKNHWLAGIEYSSTDDNKTVFWESWNLSMVDMRFSEMLFEELDSCIKHNPHAYIRIKAFQQEGTHFPCKEIVLAYKPPE